MIYLKDDLNKFQDSALELNDIHDVEHVSQPSSEILLHILNKIRDTWTLPESCKKSLRKQPLFRYLNLRRIDPIPGRLYAYNTDK